MRLPLHVCVCVLSLCLLSLSLPPLISPHMIKHTHSHTHTNPPPLSPSQALREEQVWMATSYVQLYAFVSSVFQVGQQSSGARTGRFVCLLCLSPVFQVSI